MAEKMLIDGEWAGAAKGATQPVVSPIDGRPIAEVPRGDRDDMRRAIDAARHAFDQGPWPRLPPRARAEVYLKAAKLFGERAGPIAELESRNQGKTIKQAADADIPFSIDNLVFYAGACRTLDAKSPAEFTGDGTTIFRREPIGVVGSITPWNYPVMMAVWKLGPALVTGNTVVLKPASWTPLTSLELGRIFQEAGLPAGVLNIVTGPGEVVGDELTRNPKVDLISLTGDTATGRKVMEAASGSVKRLQLELGGKAPFVVFADADLAAAVEGAVVGGFVNGGQDCTAATRLILHKDVKAKFLKHLVDRVATMRLGDPLSRSTDVGPLVHRSHQKKVLDLVQKGLEEGAKLATAGQAPAEKLPSGAFVAPTVLNDVAPDMTVAQQEIFGPVLDVLEFSTFDEGMEIANGVPYGLAGSVWTQDVRTALKAAHALRAGDVWVNDHLPLSSETPHGGFKQSGFGKDLGSDSLNDYTVVKNIYVDLTGQARKGWHYTVYGDPAQELRAMSAAPDLPPDAAADAWIGGRSVPPSTGRYAPVVDPSTGRPIGKVAVGGAEDAKAAVDAAAAVAEAWGATPGHERAKLLRAIAVRLAADRDGMARVVATEVGKPISDARVEVDRAVGVLELAADEIRHLTGESFPADAYALPAGNERRILFTLRDPIGVVVAIGPFNFPLNLLTHKIAPALAAGNPVVAKPTSAAPFTALRLVRHATAAGLPAGVLNLVLGPGGAVGNTLVEHPATRLVTFTGSTAVGKGIAERAARHAKRLILEMGGLDPFVVLDDAPMDVAVSHAVRGAFAYSGQVCTASKRILVAETIADEFARRYAERVGQLRVGPALEESTQVGPVIDASAVERLERLVGDARGRSAVVLTGGARDAARPGTFFTPTVLDHVPPEAEVAREEPFGPVSPILRFRSDDDAIALANGTNYGLQASVYTNDLRRAFRFARRIRAGGVHINDPTTLRWDALPFGGIKESGLGREGVRYAMEEMTEIKLVSVNYDPVA